MNRVRTPSGPFTGPTLLLAAVGAGVLLGLHVGGSAAPMVPARRTVSDELRAVAGIRSLRLEVGTFGQPLEEAGLEVAEIRRTWRSALAAAGIEVADGEAGDAPRLEVGGWSTGDERVPDGVGFTLYMKLLQRASVERLGEELTVPTYVKITGGLNHRAEAAEAARRLLDLFIQEFTYLASRTDER